MKKTKILMVKTMGKIFIKRNKMMNQKNQIKKQKDRHLIINNNKMKMIILKINNEKISFVFIL